MPASRNLTLNLLVCLVVTLGACGPAPEESNEPARLCDGVPADFGGYDPARPTFSATTCEEIAAEWVAAIDERAIQVINGPAVEDGKQRSSRISDVLVLSSILAGMRLDDLGLLESCDAPIFMGAARTGVSAEVMDGMGAALFDGSPVASREDWEQVLFRAIRIIDEGE